MGGINRNRWRILAGLAGALGAAAILELAASSVFDGDSQQAPQGVPSESVAAGTKTVLAARQSAEPQEKLLPCTAKDERANFDVYAPGPEVAGLPLTETLRVCENEGPPKGELPANSVAYIYGDCPYRKLDGCSPPLTVETMPACQRTAADYTFNGRPYPHRDVTDDLDLEGGAKVFYFDVYGQKRLEVYTREATVVVFAHSSALAIKAIKNLHLQDSEAPPAQSGKELEGGGESLPPPTPAAMKGTLECDAQDS
jgi:hypothetical protein